MKDELPIPKRRRSLPERVTRWIRGSLALVVFRLVQRMSIRGLRGLARILWSIAWPLSASMKRKSRANLANCMPHKSPGERERILRAATYNVVYGGLLTWRLASMTADDLRQLVEIRGREHLDAALQKGRGVIAIGAHIGPFTLIGARLAIEGYPYATVIRIASDARLERIMRRMRQQLGVTGFYRGSETLRMVKYLKRGGIVHLFLDQHVSKGGIVVEFCGMPAPTFAGPAVLARRLHCPVLPIFIVPRPDGPPDFAVEIGPEYELIWSDSEDDDILRATQLFSRTIEEMVLRYPEHWIWMHGRLLRPTDKPRLVAPELVPLLPESVHAVLRQSSAGPDTAADMEPASR